MKEKIAKLNELQKMLILASILGLIFILFSVIGLFFNQPGWLIGVVLGTIAEIVNIILLYKGAGFILKDGKAPLFLLFFFLRMVIAVLVFFLCIYLDRKLNVLVFHNSIWGAVMGFAPIEIVVLLIMSKSKSNSAKEVK